AEAGKGRDREKIPSGRAFLWQLCPELHIARSRRRGEGESGIQGRGAESSVAQVRESQAESDRSQSRLTIIISHIRFAQRPAPAGLFPLASISHRSSFHT